MERMECRGKESDNIESKVPKNEVDTVFDEDNSSNNSQKRIYTQNELAHSTTCPSKSSPPHPLTPPSQPTHTTPANPSTKMTTKKTDWVVNENNYILSHLQYTRQRNNFSCGFYVIAASATFAESLGRFPAYGFYDQSHVNKQSAEMRRECFQAYFLCVQEAYTIFEQQYDIAYDGLLSRNRYLKMFSEKHVYEYMYNIRFGYAPSPKSQVNWGMTLREEMRTDGEIIPSKLAENQYIDDINTKAGLKYRLKRKKEMRKKKKNMKKNMNEKKKEEENGNASKACHDGSRLYVCKMISKKCRAAIRIYSLPGKKRLAVHKGVHSHSPLN